MYLAAAIRSLCARCVQFAIRLSICYTVSVLSAQKNKELAAAMLPLAHPTEEREREEHWREEGTYLVVCFGMLSYRVVSEHANEKSANGSLKWWQDRARKGGMEVLPLSRNVSPHDFQVRTQESLDELTRAILNSYREE